jgi:hypothetical protein
MRPEEVAPRGLIRSLLDARNDFHNHKWMYDGASLVKLMTESGLVEVRERGFRDSGIPHIDKVEAEGRVLNGAGVVAEGIKAT